MLERPSFLWYFARYFVLYPSRHASQNFWTVPEVVAEIRDKKARHHLQTLPFELKLREPSDEAMKFGEMLA